MYSTICDEFKTFVLLPPTLYKGRCKINLSKVVLLWPYLFLSDKILLPGILLLQWARKEKSCSDKSQFVIGQFQNISGHSRLHCFACSLNKVDSKRVMRGTKDYKILSFDETKKENDNEFNQSSLYLKIIFASVASQSEAVFTVV